MYKDAVLSGCETWRWTLYRLWNQKKRKPRTVCFIMLNPSTADESVDDATIRRCIGFSKSWGYDGLVVVNLFAWRTRHSKTLKALHAQGKDIIGERNDQWLIDEARGAALVICAWGRKGTLLGRDREVLTKLRRSLITPRAIRMTPLGYPEHPLYLPGDLKPILIPRS